MNSASEQLFLRCCRRQRKLSFVKPNISIDTLFEKNIWFQTSPGDLSLMTIVLVRTCSLIRMGVKPLPFPKTNHRRCSKCLKCPHCWYWPSNFWYSVCKHYFVIWCFPYFSKRRFVATYIVAPTQFMPVHSAHIVALKHILSPATIYMSLSMLFSD